MIVAFGECVGRGAARITTSNVGEIRPAIRIEPEPARNGSQENQQYGR